MEDLQNNFSPLGTLSPSVTLSLASRAKELKKQGLDVYSMSVGEPDFDTPKSIKDAVIQALNEGKVGYIASSGLPELKDEIVKSNLPDNVKKQLISSLNKNNIKEVVIVFLKLLNIGSNIIGLFDNED